MVLEPPRRKLQMAHVTGESEGCTELSKPASSARSSRMSISAVSSPRSSTAIPTARSTTSSPSGLPHRARAQGRGLETPLTKHDSYIVANLARG